jgi:hypothetical protein
MIFGFRYGPLENVPALKHIETTADQIKKYVLVQESGRFGSMKIVLMEPIVGRGQVTIHIIDR